MMRILIFSLCLMVFLGMFHSLAFGEPGNLTITPVIPDSYLWNNGGIDCIMPGRAFEVHIYSNHEGSSSDFRSYWCAAFRFSGSGTDRYMPFAPIATAADVATPQFLSFWSWFNTVETESWDSTSPNSFYFVGSGGPGYQGGLGDIPVLKFRLEYDWPCISNWYFCVESTSFYFGPDDWLFEDPQPTFTPKCWKVVTPPCGESFITNAPSNMVLQSGEPYSFDFEAEGACFPPDDYEFKLMRGRGVIDPITGVWNFTPDSSLGWSETEINVGVRSYYQCATFSTVSLTIRGICGNVNGDQLVNILDAVYLLNFIYKNGPPPPLMVSGDVNNSGGISILDAVYLITYLYKQGPAPDCP